jgi:hypothetical protein
MPSDRPLRSVFRQSVVNQIEDDLIGGSSLTVIVSLVIVNSVIVVIPQIVVILLIFVMYLIILISVRLAEWVLKKGTPPIISNWPNQVPPTSTESSRNEFLGFP